MLRPPQVSFPLFYKTSRGAWAVHRLLPSSPKFFSELPGHLSLPGWGAGVWLEGKRTLTSCFFPARHARRASSLYLWNKGTDRDDEAIGWGGSP